MPSSEFNHILYQNVGENGANWVGFILEGTISNRDGVGSIVTLYTGEKRQIRLTRCGDQHFNQYNPYMLSDGITWITIDEDGNSELVIYSLEKTFEEYSSVVLQSAIVMLIPLLLVWSHQSALERRSEY